VTVESDTQDMLVGWHCHTDPHMSKTEMITDKQIKQKYLTDYIEYKKW